MPVGPVLDVLEERKLVMKEWARLQDLICKCKAQMPEIAAIWDKTKDSIKFNDIETSEVVHIYCATMTDLWAGIYKPSVYGLHPVWKTLC